jgi:hypothetical protein
MKDAFDRWWGWATNPVESMLTTGGDIHYAVMELPPEDRHDRAKVNEAVRRYRESRKCSTQGRSSFTHSTFIWLSSWC